jgi:hypothetical protein
MKTAISELDSATFVKAWNSAISDEKLAEKLDCTWSLIKSKLRVKSVTALLTKQRKDLPKDFEGATGEAAAAKTVKSHVTTKKGSAEAKAAQNLFKARFAIVLNVNGTKQIIEAEDANGAMKQIIDICLANKYKKANLVRDGRIIEQGELRDGDKIVLQASVGGASV